MNSLPPEDLPDQAPAPRTPENPPASPATEPSTAEQSVEPTAESAPARPTATPAPEPQTPAPAVIPEQPAASPAPAQSPSVPRPTPAGPVMESVTPPPPTQTQQFAAAPAPPVNFMPAPRRPGRGVIIGLSIALAALGFTAGTFAILFSQKSNEVDEQDVLIEELRAAETEAQQRADGLSASLEDLQEVSDEYDECSEAFEAYTDHVWDGDFNPDTEDFEDLFTEEYIEWRLEDDELFREAERQCIR